MRIAVASAAFPPDLPIDHVLSAAGRHGFEAVELAIGETARLTFATGQEECARLAGAADRAGVAVSALFVTESASTKPASPNQATGQRPTPPALTAAMERAAWLGADTVVFSPTALGMAGWAKPGFCREDVYSMVLAALLELRFEAERRAVRLALLAGRNRLLLSSSEARDLIDRVNSPWAGIALNTGDLLPLGHSEDWISALGHRLAHLRIGASPPTEPGTPPPGDIAGSAPHGLPAIVTALGQVRYQGVVAFDAPDPVAAHRLAAAFRQAEQHSPCCGAGL